MRSGKSVRQVPINLVGGVCSTIITSIRKQGIANILPPNKSQHYTAVLVIDEAK